jgi:hypothetical protein
MGRDPLPAEMVGGHMVQDRLDELPELAPARVQPVEVAAHESQRKFLGQVLCHLRVAGRHPQECEHRPAISAQHGALRRTGRRPNAVGCYNLVPMSGQAIQMLFGPRVGQWHAPFRVR